ncbi:ATP-binding protein [Actinocorallia lasiicapitis]
MTQDISTQKRTITAVFPGRPDQVRLARHCLSAWLDPAHPATDTATLLLSETFTNSVLHASAGTPDPPVEISATLTASLLRVHVTDCGGPTEPLRNPAPTPDDEHGRGLELLNLTAKDWGHHPLPDGRLTLWFTLTF